MVGRGLWFMGFGFGLIWAVASTFSGLIGVSWVKLRSMWLRRFSRLIIGVFLGFSMAWVSNWRRGFLIGGLDLLIGGLGGGSGGRFWLQLVCVWLGVCGRC